MIDPRVEAMVTSGKILTKQFWEEQAREVEALFTCACLMHGNWPSGHHRPETTAVFLPGLAVDNWQTEPGDTGVLSTAAELWNIQAGDWVVIPGNPGTRPSGISGSLSPTGYPGGTIWRAALLDLGVPDDHIVSYAEAQVGPDGRSWNTRTEIDDFVHIAQTRAWHRAFVVCTPFHLLRVMLTLVKSLQDQAHTMRLEPVTPRSISWTKRVYHSQGLQQLPRHAHIKEEWARIPRYQANDSICTFADLHAYLVSQLGS